MGRVRETAHAGAGHAPVETGEVGALAADQLAARETAPVGRCRGEQVLRSDSAEDGADCKFADAHGECRYRGCCGGVGVFGLVPRFNGTRENMRESVDAPAPEKVIRDFCIFLVSSQSQPYDLISVTTPVQPKVRFGAMSENQDRARPVFVFLATCNATWQQGKGAQTLLNGL